MNLEWVSKPGMIRAIQFLKDGSNYDAVISIVQMNGGHAELIYTDKDGRPVEAGRFTEHRAILLQVGPHQSLVVPKGCFIILEPDQMVPVQEAEFLAMNVPLSEINSIGNGQFTFAELLKEIDRLNPPFEEVLISQPYKVLETMSAIDFIKQTAMIHTDADGKEYYVVNGQTYTF